MFLLSDLYFQSVYLVICNATDLSETALSRHPTLTLQVLSFVSIAYAVPETSSNPSFLGDIFIDDNTYYF
jgi:hypothetical protein